MSGIKHKIAVMSCKGGVGKSTFAANLAAALAMKGRKTTILDCDFHGPCIPKILGVEGKGLKIGKKGIVPVLGSLDVGVISMAFLLRMDETVTWFDPLKKTTVEQFLANVDYGSLDYLIIDLPPGTGTESYGLLQYTPGLDGTLIITLPSEGICTRSHTSTGTSVFRVCRLMSSSYPANLTGVKSLLSAGRKRRGLWAHLTRLEIDTSESFLLR